MSERHIYHPGFMKPIALIGENMAIWLMGNWHYYLVAKLVSIPPSQIAEQNFGAVGAGGILTNQQFTNLRVTSGDFIQVRIWPLDDIQIVVNQPQGTSLHQMSAVNPAIDVFTILDDPELVTTEMYIYEFGNGERIPFLNITNPTQYALTRSVVAFMGYRYRLEELATALVTKEMKQDPSAAKFKVAFTLGEGVP